MTYPTDPNNALDSGGAFVVGDDWQPDVTEAAVKALVAVPSPTDSGALDTLEDHLGKLPLDALQTFQPLIPGAGSFANVPAAVASIMGALTASPWQMSNADWEAWLADVWGTLVTAFNDSVEWVVRLVSDILILLDVFHIFHSASAWTDAWNDLLDLFGIVNSTTPLDQPEPTIGPAIEAAQSSASTAQYSTETLSGFWNEPRVLPPWTGPLADEVAFPRDRVPGTATPTLGTMLLIPIKITQDRVIDAIKVGCAGNSMTNFYVGLYDIDETTGDCSKVLDLGDRKADLDLAYSVQTFILDEPKAVQQNELYFIAILQVGGTAGAMHRSTETYNMTDGTYPKNLGSTWATTGITTMPSTMDDADVVIGTRYWGALGTSVAPVTPGGKYLSETFGTYANDAYLATPWTVRKGSVQVWLGRPYETTGSGETKSTHNTRLNSITQRVGWEPGGVGGANVYRNGISLRGNGAGACVAVITERIHVAVPTSAYVNRIYIRTFAGAYSSMTYTDRVSITTDPPLTGLFTCEAVGDIYTVYRNGVQVAQWDDSGHAFPVTGSNTEVGFLTSETATPIQFDNWYAQDL